MRLSSLIGLLLVFLASTFAIAEPAQPVRVAVAGLVHTHVHWLLGREDRGDIEIVGIAEPNRDLAQRYADQHGYSMNLVYDGVDEMLDATRPDAVAVFTDIRDHLAVTREAAKRGVHVMVEKPLAISLAHAVDMKQLAEKAGIHLLTNYESTWYPSVHEAKAVIDSGAIGPLRRMVFRYGHQGPIEIGCNPEFVEWLADPASNGAGALTDFGCYGAAIATWLLDGRRPQSVFAQTRRIKPALYPDVDDDATILLDYGDATAVIQASWNWPYSRKDMDLYGQSGHVLAPARDRLVVRVADGGDEPRETKPLTDNVSDPFAYLAAVVRGEIDPGDDLSSLPTNMVAMEVLDAALRSARDGVAVRLESE